MIVYIKPSLLGDTILVEPAITAWSKAHGNERVKLYLPPANSPYACLFRGNPAVVTIPWSSEIGADVMPDSLAAFWEAHRLKLPFAAGYFSQFGLTPNSGDRLHFKLFGDDRETTWDKGGFLHDDINPYVCICPNARSCMSSVYRGATPNIKATTEWWKPVVDHIVSQGKKVINVGSPDGMEISGTEHWTGSDFRSIARMLAGSCLVISVETGLLHLAGGIKGLPIIFLSSATPADVDDPTSYFAAPKGARIVRSKVWKQAMFDQEEVISQIKEILETS